MHSKNIRAYLDSVAGVAALLPQAERLIGLRRTYGELVPKQLLQSSSIVNYKQGKVVIFAENSAVAAKLKLLSSRLIDDFSNRGWEITGIRVEVQPRETPENTATAKQARLSPAGAGYLKALAERLPDSKLKHTLADMARHQTTSGSADGSVQSDPEQKQYRGGK